MLLLTSTSDKIQVITGTAVTVDVHASYADYDSAASPPVTLGRKNTKISTAATTDVVLAPGNATTSRNVKALHISNIHASSSVLVTVQHTDGSNVVELEKVTLLANERISYREGVGMRVIDSAGREKLPTVGGQQGAATTSQIAAHSADTYYLGMPVAGRIQAGSSFRWVFAATKAAAGTVAPTYNIRFGTGGVVGDTSRCLMTGTLQTAAADSAFVTVDATFRVVGASAVIQGRMWMDHFLAVTGFTTTVNHHAMVETTGGAFDSTPAGSILGLSVNPGTSGAWVVNQVNLDAMNLLN